MNNLDVDDWDVLRGVANDRLGPDRIAAWFFATLIYSVVFIIIPVLYCINDGYNSVYKIITLILVILFVLNVILLVHYNRFKYMYTSQNLQSVFYVYMELKYQL